MSLRQIAEALTLITASSGPGRGSGISLTTAVRSPGKRTAFISPSSLLDRPERQALDDAAAQDEDDHQHRPRDDHGRSGYVTPLGSVHTRELVDPDRGGFGRAASQGHGEKELIPRQHRGENCRRRDSGSEQWKDDPA